MPSRSAFALAAINPAVPDFLNLSDFSAHLGRAFPDLKEQAVLAVGLSGGPDSLALTKALSDWAVAGCGPEIHALIVDHGLRAQSAQEAEKTAETVRKWPHVKPCILNWEGAKPAARIQEEARKARYKLMAEHCRAHDIRHLFLAHHQDDQGETLLFRLAKGSGLDGLCGMQLRQDYEGLVLCRPFLGLSKDSLVRFCGDHNLPFVRDPSNGSEKFARGRLRGSWGVLEEEGLSSKRLARTASRFGRIRNALDRISEEALQNTVLEKDASRITLNFAMLKTQPDEIVLRALLKAMDALSGKRDYGPRMEKTEKLLEELLTGRPFRKRTLGGVIFERKDKTGKLILTRE